MPTSTDLSTDATELFNLTSAYFTDVTDVTDVTDELTTNKTCLPECTGLGWLRDPKDSCIDDGQTCSRGYLNTGECCMSQNLIIFIAALGGGVIILVFMSVMIWLSTERKKYRKWPKLPDGADNKAFSGDGTAQQGYSADGSVPALMMRKHKNNSNSLEGTTPVMTEPQPNNVTSQPPQAPELVPRARDGAPHRVPSHPVSPAHSFRDHHISLYDDIAQYGNQQIIDETSYPAADGPLHGNQPRQSEYDSTGPPPGVTRVESGTYQNHPELTPREGHYGNQDITGREAQPEYQNPAHEFDSSKKTVNQPREDDYPHMPITQSMSKAIKNFIPQLDNIDTSTKIQFKRPKLSMNINKEVIPSTIL